MDLIGPCLKLCLFETGEVAGLQDISGLLGSVVIPVLRTRCMDDVFGRQIKPPETHPRPSIMVRICLAIDQPDG